MPAIADSPDTEQSARSDITNDQSHSSWKEVGHAVWPRDGEKKRPSSASLSIRHEVFEMLQESYERDDHGNVTRIQELERRAGMSEQQVAHILKRSDEQLREAA